MISPDLLGQTLKYSKHADVSCKGCNHRVHTVRERKTKKGRMGNKYQLAPLQEETQPGLCMRNTSRQEPCASDTHESQDSNRN